MRQSPDGKAQPWKEETMLARLQACRFMLHLHEFLTEAESRRVEERLKKWVRKHQKAK